jgi:hypothetical protein
MAWSKTRIPTLHNSSLSITPMPTATVNFYTPPMDGAAPWYDGTRAPPHHTNASTHPVQVDIEDLRGKEDTVTLDTAGFQFGVHESAFTDFHDEQKIRDAYYPESVELIKRVTGARHIVIFHHSMRTIVLAASGV